MCKDNENFNIFSYICTELCTIKEHFFTNEKKVDLLHIFICYDNSIF